MSLSTLEVSVGGERFRRELSTVVCHRAEGKGSAFAARFGRDGITIRDPNRAGEGAAKVFEKICDRAI